MLYIKEGFALFLGIILLVVSYLILPSFLKSVDIQKHIQKPRKFHNIFLFRIDKGIIPPSYHLDDYHYDIKIDLEITYPYAILTVDDP